MTQHKGVYVVCKLITLDMFISIEFHSYQLDPAKHPAPTTHQDIIHIVQINYVRVIGLPLLYIKGRTSPILYTIHELYPKNPKIMQRYNPYVCKIWESVEGGDFQKLNSR